ncbi:HEAT repeat domain-containing protein [Streptomyces sp. NPDC058746]|uniref:HEAT repeat domain-containing protein n=1 Tax=Streptomyces sp. NPDC058746 TaxID=3346622 RepID=UPI0036B10BE3
MGFTREELRRALRDLQEAAQQGTERTQAELQRQVRATRLPGTERFHGQRASEWAASAAEDFRLPKSADVLLAVVAVWSSWLGRRTLEPDGRVRQQWLAHPECRSWRVRYEAAAAEANEDRRSRERRGGLSARTDAAVADYLRRLVQTHSRLNMDVLGEASRAGEQPQIGLGKVFEAPLLAWDWPRQHLSERLVRDLLDRGEIDDREMKEQTARDTDADVRRERERGQGRGPGRRERPAQPVLDVLGSENGHRLVVLGDPGAGKTTLSKYLALALAGGLDTVPDGLEALKDAVPVIVELRRLADPRWVGATVEDYWAEHNAAERMALPREVLEDLLAGRQRTVVMVFDGLDEVFDPARRADIARQIAAFAQSHPHARVVVTSRLIGFRAGEFTRADFGIAKLENLSRTQVESFIGRWYATAHPESPAEAARLTRRLTDAVRDFPSVAELAGNPLLLAILAAIGLGASIPRDRKDVYEHAVVVLAGRWDRDAKHLRLPRPAHPDVAHAIDELDGRTLQDLLECIAARIQEGADGGSPLIAVDELEQVIRGFVSELGYATPVARTVARAMIERLHERAFLIHPFGAEAYGFVHRTLLEYLAARDLAHRYRQWNEDELLDLLMDRAVNPGWREVMLLFLGMISRDAESLHARFIARLLRLHRYCGGAPLFRSHGDTEFLDFALEALAEAHRIGRAPAGPPLSPEQAESSLAVQSDAVIDAITAELTMFPGVGFRRGFAALPSFPGSWSGRERFRRWLWPHLTRTLDASSSAARIGLAMCRDAAEALAFVHVTWNEAGAVAVRALGERWPHEPAVRETLFALARGADADGDVRSEALRTVAERYTADAEARAVLIGASCEAEAEPNVRGAALLLLAKHWSSDPECRRTVLAVAHDTGAEPEARGRLLGALARYWEADPEARRALLGAVGDENPNVRRQVWSALAEGRPAEEELRPLAMAALGDTNQSVREAAIDCLGTHWPQDAETRLAAFSAARTAGSSRVFATLGRRWPEDGGLRQMLLEVARDGSLTVEDLNTVWWVLGIQWPQDAEIRHLLFGLTRHEDPQVRWQVLDVLQQSWPADDEVRRATIAAMGDSVAVVRQASLELAGYDWPGDLELRAALMAGVRDGDTDVRWLAVDRLAQQWPEDGEVRRAVLTTALDDEEADVRRTAVQALAAQWPEHPETLRAVLAAVGDTDAVVRSLALRLSGDYWPGHEQVRAAAFQATYDAVPMVVLSALRVLAQRWPDAPETRSAAERCVDGPLRIHALRLLTLVWPRHQETLRTVQQVRQQESPKMLEATSPLLAFIAAASGDGST